MVRPMNGRVFLFALLLTFLLIPSGFAADAKCPICNMVIQKDSKTAFESVRENKPVHVCSFSCAHRFHKRFPDAEIFVKDYVSGKRISAKVAFFLVKSKNILKEIDFEMPPTVVAFSTEADAKKVKARLGDGELVQGFDALQKVYE